ncbi:MAG TPA: hypothetical protein VF683_01535 [Chthoniobacterales bacterium]
MRSSPETRSAFALVELMISTVICSAITAALLMAFVSLKRNYVATTDFATNHTDQMRISDYLALDLRRAIKLDPPVTDTPVTNDISMVIPRYYDATGNTAWTATRNGDGGSFYLPARSGSGAPAATFGLDGDLYVDEAANQVYGPKANGNWGLASPLVIRNGVVPPTASIGADGDFYVDTKANIVYGRKTGGAWGSGTSVVSRVHYYLQGETVFRQQDSGTAIAIANNVQDFKFTPDDPHRNNPNNKGKVVTTMITFRPTFRSMAGSEETRTATSFHNTTLLRNSPGVY